MYISIYIIEPGTAESRIVFVQKQHGAAAGPMRAYLGTDVKEKREVDALGVITSSRGCFERCCSNKKTPPFHSNLSFVTLRNRRPQLLRAPAYRTPSEAIALGDGAATQNVTYTNTRQEQHHKRPHEGPPPLT